MKLIDERDDLTTYRYLRISIPVLAVLLGASVAHQVLVPRPDCWLGSISAYYYTSARAVFVACLCGIGASLIVYHGNTPREDFALNVSGFLAFVVALIPTPLAELVISPRDLVGPAQEPICKRSNVPTQAQLTDAINNNIWALLVAATVVACVVLWFRTLSRPSGGTSASVFLLLGSLLLGWVIFAVQASLLRAHGHLFAAVTMFAGIVVVVTLNAVPSPRLDPRAVPAPARFLRLYRLILALMLSAIVVLGAAALAGISDHAVFWLEASLIGLFAAFWVVQTKELWNLDSRQSGG